MSLNHSDRNLVNRYLIGDLSGIELESFHERIQNDDLFKADVNLQNILRGGILLSKEEELKKAILESIKFRKTKVPYALKLIVTFIIVTGLGITLWFYVGKDSANQHNVNLFFPFLSKVKDKNTEKKNVKEKTTNEGSRKIAADSSAGYSNTRDADQDLAAVKEGESSGKENQLTVNDSVPQAIAEGKDIVIKKDQLLIGLSLPVNEKSPEKKVAENAHATTENVVQKLNPSAGVPDEEIVASTVETEFWISPVNYRGYKMSKNKLILFGIEEPDAVKLYRMNDVLYMKYGSEFFRLTNTFEFLSYQRLKDTEVPLAIKQ
jgi:hypothetical protein